MIGDVACICDPYCYVLDNDFIEQKCDNCFKTLKRNSVSCTGCHYVHYCNKYCRETAIFNGHDFECLPLRSMFGKKVNERVRMWGRLIIKTMKGLNHEWHEFALNSRVSIDSVPIDVDKLNENKKLEKEYALDCEEFKDYFAVNTTLIKNWTTENLKRYYYTMRYSTIKINESLGGYILGYGLYLAPSVMSYNCISNSFAKFEGLRMTIVITKEIPNLMSLTQVHIGNTGIYDFNKSFNGFRLKEATDCACYMCNHVYMEFVACEDPKCKTPFIIQESKCPKCNKELSNEFLKRYYAIRFRTFEYWPITSFSPAKKLTEKEAKALYDDISEFIHPWNAIRTRLMGILDTYIIGKDYRTELIKYYENLSQNFDKIRGDFTQERVHALVELTTLYCRFCECEKAIKTCINIRKALLIIANENCPQYISNEAILDKLRHTTLRDCICGSNF